MAGAGNTLKWRDATSYGRDERGVIEPRTWATDSKIIHVVVTCGHIYHRDTKAWVLNFGTKFNAYELKDVPPGPENHELAKAKAIELVREHLQRQLAELA